MQYLNTAMELAQKAGDRIMELYEQNLALDKEDEFPVTEADLESNRIIVEGLEKTGIPIISEETKELHVKEEKLMWVIDPLDGTKDFVERTGEFAVMIALMEDRQPVLGVVYAPAIDKLYYAAKGEGAWLREYGEDIKLQVSDKELEKMVVSRFHLSEEMQQIAERLGVKEFKKMGSVGVKYGAIAEGKAELCIYTNSKMGIWDDAAPHILLTEAGGKVFDCRGKEPEYDYVSKRMENGFIGTNGKGNILEVIK